MSSSITTIQIIGDIHSGTRWLTSLIRKNLISKDIKCTDSHKHFYFSKFQPEENYLYVYPVRAYESWLPRLKVNHYNEAGQHYLRIDDSMIYQKYSDNVLSNLEILQGFNFICGNLESLQKDQGSQLITTISKNFNIPVLRDFEPITKHTKSRARWWRRANNSPQPNYNFDYCNNHSFESLLNQLEAELLFNTLL